MLAYYGSHILHAAVAYFDVVLVEKGVILVLLREMFRYELKKGFADVSFHAVQFLTINNNNNNNNKQLLDEVEHDIMNYQNRGLCYLPKPKAEADNTDTKCQNRIH